MNNNQAIRSEIIDELNQKIKLCLSDKGYSIDVSHWTVILSDYNDCVLITCAAIYRAHGDAVYNLILDECVSVELHRP